MMEVMDAFHELRWRGLIHQVTSEVELPKLLAEQQVTMYIGFDPTAASLHAGSLIPLTILRHFRRSRHRIIALVGGATGLIGDPSGKSQERTLETTEIVESRVEALKKQIARFLDQDDGPPVTYVNNLDWLGETRLLTFLRDVGKHFSVNEMVHKDSVQRRFDSAEGGISYTEFSYMLLQAADYLELYRRYGCRLQCGASDQWGNIVEGIELIRRAEGAKAYGLTAPLLTTSDGKKYGKTEKGAIFLDGTMTSPYAFYQFWVNTKDEDVGRFLRWFTFLHEAAIRELENEVGSGARVAQKKLAFEVTAAVHGQDEAQTARLASEALFSGNISGLSAATLLQMASDVPSITVSPGGISGGASPRTLQEELQSRRFSVVELLVAAGACTSKADARRQISQKAIRINGRPCAAVEEGDPTVGFSDFLEGKVLVLQRGKRDNYLVIVQPPSA
jgi:tyrosyl-tRNA synthetase